MSSTEMLRELKPWFFSITWVLFDFHKHANRKKASVSCVLIHYDLLHQ